MNIKKALVFIHLVLVSWQVSGQSIDLTKTSLSAINVSMSLTDMDGKKAVRVIKDPSVKGADAASFVRLNDIGLRDGSIELKVLSRLLPDAGEGARGFIGVAFRINTANTQFESIYIRPTNGRAEQQIRRNHAIQYFSYPDYPFDRLRKEAPGEYESYADMGLNEWIKLRIEVKGLQAKLYVNDATQPSLIVNDLKLGSGNSGAIGLFVDGGTDGFFTDNKVVKAN